MTVSSFMGLQTALRALEAEQQAIDTTGHNIANANTPGYSRQAVQLTESIPLTIPANSNVTGAGVQLGTGVDVTMINRIRDQFLDIQYRAQNTTASGASSQSTILTQVQSALAEPSPHGLSSQMSAFYSAWSDLANAPSSSAARQTVIGAATTLAQTLNQLDQQLGAVQSQTAQQYAAITGPNGQVQSDANQIATLNASISQALAAGQKPNDLMDQRDQLIDGLSALGKVSVVDPGNGLLQVSFGDAATPLVNGQTVNWPQTLTAATGGQLGALLNLSSASGQISSYRATLDSVASQLVSSVNALHTATPFFSGNSAATISVAATAATVQTGSTAAAGANDVALAIAGLSGGAADQSYGAFVAQVGGDVQAADNGQQTQQQVLAALDTQRQSVSGVSLDEEMTNLITYQRGYQAAARVMTTVDQMLDTLINHTGVAGL
jgi:flagellar hook-associated protein 1 FlgK